MSEKKFAVGVDIGGTWVRVAFFNLNEKNFVKTKEHVDIQNDMALSEQIIRIVHNLAHKFNIPLDFVEGVGIASAGPLDSKEGVLIKPTNLPFEKVFLVEPIRKKLEVPVVLINDCTAGVLGEQMFGRGKGIDNLFYVAMGTGIGGGAIIDGHLLIGKDGNAAEIGHFVIDYEGKLTCGCGKRGHWEAYCSGRNIPNFVDMKLKQMRLEDFLNSTIIDGTCKKARSLTSESLFKAANNGDPLSLILVEEIGFLNAIGFANIVNAYDPALISIGGTIALNNSKLVLTPIMNHIRAYAINKIPEMVITPLGEDTGLLGGIAAILGQTITD